VPTPRPSWRAARDRQTVGRMNGSDRGAEAPGDLGPRGVIGEGRRQMQHKAAGTGDDPRADLEQAFAQRRDLRARVGGAGRVPPKFLQQDVRGGGEEHAQLVGPEPHATRAIDLEAVMQFLDPILDVAALTVHALVDPARALPQIGDDEPRVVARLAARQADDFGLDEDPALGRPGARGIPHVAVHMGRLARLGGIGARDGHQGRGMLREHRVFRHADDVLDAFGVQAVEQRGIREAAIEPDAQARAGKGLPQHPTQAPDQRPRADGRRGVAGAQQRRTQILLRFVVEGEKREERQIAPGVVVPVKERQLLGAMRWIVRDVEVDRDAAGPPAQPLALLIDHGRRQLAADAIQRAWADAILKPRDRRLRGEGLALHRMAVEQQLLDRIVGEPVRIVPIGIAGGDAEDALREHIPQRMRDARRITSVREAGRQSRREIQASVRRLQQDRAAIRTGVRLIDGRDEGLGKEVRKQNTLWYRVVGQIKRLRREESSCGNGFLSRGGVCVSTDFHFLTNNPG
jgi:hypothetical protein